MRSTLAACLASAMLLATLPVHAQQTLDERIRKAAEAQTAKEAAERAKALEAQRATLTAVPPGTPTVVINADPSKMGGTLPKPAALPQREAVDLVQIKGFMDVPNGLEAVIAVNDRRHAVSMAHRQLSEGWELTALTSEYAEVSRGTTRRVLRIAPAQMPTQAPAQSGAKTP